MLDVQKKQRLETAERFQKQLERVSEVLKATTASLPDENQLDIDELLQRTSRLIKNAREAKDKLSKKDNQSASACTLGDRVICDYVDSNST